MSKLTIVERVKKYVVTERETLSFSCNKYNFMISTLSCQCYMVNMVIQAWCGSF